MVTATKDGHYKAITHSLTKPCLYGKELFYSTCWKILSQHVSGTHFLTEELSFASTAALMDPLR